MVDRLRPNNKAKSPYWSLNMPFIRSSSLNLLNQHRNTNCVGSSFKIHFMPSVNFKLDLYLGNKTLVWETKLLRCKCREVQLGELNLPPVAWFTLNISLLKPVHILVSSSPSRNSSGHFENIPPTLHSFSQINSEQKMSCFCIYVCLWSLIQVTANSNCRTATQQIFSSFYFCLKMTILWNRKPCSLFKVLKLMELKTVKMRAEALCSSSSNLIYTGWPIQLRGWYPEGPCKHPN